MLWCGSHYTIFPHDVWAAWFMLVLFFWLVGSPREPQTSGQPHFFGRDPLAYGAAEAGGDDTSERLGGHLYLPEWGVICICRLMKAFSLSVVTEDPVLR